MLKIYKYIYYRAYDLLGLTGKYDLAWSASYFMGVFLALIVFNILINFKYSLGSLMLSLSGMSVFAIVLIINYFIFLKGNGYRDIILNNKHESEYHRLIGRWALVLSYILFVLNLF